MNRARRQDTILCVTEEQLSGGRVDVFACVRVKDEVCGTAS